MFRPLGLLLAMLIVGYALWPYYSLLRVDAALRTPDARALAPWVDLNALREQAARHSRQRPAAEAPGPDAFPQDIGLDSVRAALLDAARQAGPTSASAFFGAIDFAFFESWNRFVVRFGALGGDTTHVVLNLVQGRWIIGDLTNCRGWTSGAEQPQARSNSIM